MLDAAIKFEPERGKFRSYAPSRIRGSILDGMKLGKRRCRGEVEIDEAIGLIAKPNRDADQRRSREVVRAMTEGMQRHVARAIELHFVDGFTFKEVGSVLGISKNLAPKWSQAGIQQLAPRHLAGMESAKSAY